MYKLLLCWRVSADALPGAGLHRQRHARRGHAHRRQQRHGRLQHQAARPAARPALRRRRSRPATTTASPTPKARWPRIRADPFLNEHIEAMAPTLEIFAMLQFTCNGKPITRPVRLIGIDPEGRARVGGFAEHLQLTRTSRQPSFDAAATRRTSATWNTTAFRAWCFSRSVSEPLGPTAKPPPAAAAVQQSMTCRTASSSATPSPTSATATDSRALDVQEIRTPAARRRRGHHHRQRPAAAAGLRPARRARLLPVRDERVRRQLRLRAAGLPAEAADDGGPRHQHPDPAEGLRRVPKAVVTDACEAVRRHHRSRCRPGRTSRGRCWRAIAVEKGILNVLLFMIIAVAGFGILAIFSMIVVEKTRDIGILKALGASNGGVMKIFLELRPAARLVGSGCRHRAWRCSSRSTSTRSNSSWPRSPGRTIFPRDVYYFDKIPTDIQRRACCSSTSAPSLIAVLFSVLPALRAAMLHPVRALRVRSITTRDLAIEFGVTSVAQA